MKPSDTFKKVIEQHLEEVAAKDSLFAETLKKEDKNIDDCIQYIFNTVQKSGCNGFADEEIFGMAIHYYDEDTIDIGKKVNMKVVVNHQQEAIKKSFAEPLKPEKKTAKKPAAPVSNNQITLF